MRVSSTSPGATPTIGPSAPLMMMSPALSGLPTSTIVRASHSAALSGLPRHAAPAPNGHRLAAPLHRHPAQAQVERVELARLRARARTVRTTRCRRSVSSSLMFQFAMRLPTISTAGSA